jgi:hypothetical protein
MRRTAHGVSFPAATAPLGIAQELRAGSTRSPWFLEVESHVAENEGIPMKYTKAASVLAVSMVAVGAASSAAVAQTSMPTSPSMSLTSGLAQVADAYNTHTKSLDNPVPLVSSAAEVAKKVNDTKNKAPMKLVEGAVGDKGAGSMLGGLPVGR